MKEETITRILHAEHDAVTVFTDAQREVTQYLAETELQAQTSREHILSEARQQAKAIIAEGRSIANAKRASLIAHAGADAQGMETMSTRHFDDAVHFVLQVLTGQN